MRLNADFSQRAVIRPDDYSWVDSPMPGVERMMLDRIGDEVARATSLVRYAPNSTFSRHEHTGGEEFFVLEGEFRDEHGAYPAGTYVRNPIGTAHTPSIGEQGCLIFVKLQQFEQEDQLQFSIDTTKAEWAPGIVPGLEVLGLHEARRPFGFRRVNRELRLVLLLELLQLHEDEAALLADARRMRGANRIPHVRAGRISTVLVPEFTLEHKELLATRVLVA